MGNCFMSKGARRLSESKRKELTGNLLLFSMFTLETIYLYSASSIALFICGIPGIITLFLYVLKDKGPFRLLMIGIAVGIVALVTINRILILNCGWSGCLRIVFISLPIACLLCNVHIDRRAALLFFYGVFVYTVIMIALADPAQLYRIFAASSRNYISVLLIACLFPYYLACERDRAEVSVFPALLSLPVSIYVQSRGGMIASGILYVLTLVREIYLGTAKGAFKDRRRLICFLISLVILFAVVLITVNRSNIYLSRFSGVEEYPITRLDMWKEYMTATVSSAKNTILGTPLMTCPLITAEAYNIHNAYLMTHSYMGIAGLVAVIAGEIGYLALCFRRKHYDLLFLSIAFLARAMTDYLFPMLFCDCIVLFMMIKTGMGMMRADDEYQK